MHLWSHVKQLYYLIRRRAIVQYFTPYAVADMDKMAVIFRVHVSEVMVLIIFQLENFFGYYI